MTKMGVYLQKSIDLYWVAIATVFVLGLVSVPTVETFEATTLKPKPLECEYYNATECKGLTEGEYCTNSSRMTTCGGADGTWSCYALWQRGKNATKEVLQFKGCFLNNKQCTEKSCVEKNHPRDTDTNKPYTYYCCCATDNCNRDYTFDPVSTTTTLKPTVLDLQRPNSSSILVLTLVPLCCGLFVTGAYIFHRRIYKKPLPNSESQLTDEENILLDKSESSHTLSVTLVEIKAAGRFGAVWKSSMAGHNNYVAVKILPLREKASWKLEQEVYSLPLMCDSEFILGFFGARPSHEGDNMQLWLISEYIEQGSLYDFLKGHILTWNDLMKVATTMCQGLAFLHEEIDAGVKGVKPAVAHRDFKSKNVLLRSDLTACVADFGLAHIFYPTKPVGTNHGQVGTRRYMAPEVLDGAVSFTRDNFQRIDMYACGLVLWELASRCNAQQGPIGEYRLPFEEHVGQQPTLEEMIEAVVTQRKRPTIRNDWLSHPGLAVLTEAMKDAWDQDSEARISASCIVERLTSVNNKIM